MIPYSLLYPVTNTKRLAVLLDGLWRFQFDSESKGMTEKWQERGLPDSISMAVPGSFSEVFTESEKRDYCGDFWYETQFFLPADYAGKKQYIRFGSVTNRCRVYCNGILVAEHEGGFLPVVADVTEAAVSDGPNRLVVWVNNELNETSMPCGTVKYTRSGQKRNAPYFDFFNFGGIHRSVWLVQTNREAIQDYTVRYELDGGDALVYYEVVTSGESSVSVVLRDAEGGIAARAEGKEGILRVPNAHLWKVRGAYLYTLTMSVGEVDEYSAKIGIRTVEIRDNQFYISGEKVYLKGFGKHEDCDILGKGFNYAVAKRDFECLKWMNANCFRTSHYPYAEEWYHIADEEGFLIIDEVPAVGLMRSFTNYLEAGTGSSYTGFFRGDHVAKLQQHHLQVIEETITRDKNHPSVFSFSIFNEAETTSPFAHDYFAPVFERARELDSQHRPLTGALEKSSGPNCCQVYPLMDFVCLNRYYGWYIHGGEMEDAEAEFLEEMEQWAVRYPNHPFIFTEYGTDTLPEMHRLPAVMWSQEYQEEYMEMYAKVFDRYPWVAGELAWNFADFQTGQGIMRVGGNKKGAFTRERQPKQMAHILRKRWLER